MKLLKFLIGWPISIVSLVFIAKIIQPQSQEIISYIKNVNWFLLLFSILSFFAYFVGRGLLWSNLLKEKGYEIEFKKLLYAWNISEIKRYTPGNIWSLLGRTLSFSDLGVKKADVIHLLLFESELVVAGTVISSLLALSFITGLIPNDLPELLLEVLILGGTLFLGFLFVFNPLKIHLLPKFRHSENIKLIILSVLTFFFFGLGSFLAATSLIYLNPKDILIFIGFFNFALLIGYLSLITPMGLGVREGVLTIGLSKILTLEIAGFVAIFARIIFIISEVIFLLISFIWLKARNDFLQKLELFIVGHKYEVLVFIFAFIYFAYMTTASFLRFDNFYAGRFDLGNMDQTVWNTINGRIFEFTNPDSIEIVSRLAFHSDFLLILLSPLYLIWANPKMLLLVQSLVLAIGGIFVFLIASKYIKNKYVPLIISFIYFINPSLNNSNLYEFHAVVLATTFLLASFYFLKIKKLFLFLIFLLLSAISKEQVWITTGMIGLYLFLFQKQRLIGLLIFLISLVSFIYLMEFAFPNAAKGEHFALKYYSQLGDSPSRVIRNIVLAPDKVIPTLFDESRIYYLNQLLLPFGYLAISPYLVFALPDLAINLMSSNSNLYKIYFQYTAIITPFLFISVIWTFVFLKRYLPRINLSVLTALILFTSLYSAWKFGPLPGAENPNLGMFTHPLSNRKTIDNFLNKIPIEYSLSATNNVGSKISQRRYIFVIPHGMNSADMVIFLLRKGPDDPGEKGDRENLKKVRLDNKYVEVFKDEGFIVFQKKNLR